MLSFETVMALACLTGLGVAMYTSPEPPPPWWQAVAGMVVFFPAIRAMFYLIDALDYKTT